MEERHRAILSYKITEPPISFPEQMGTPRHGEVEGQPESAMDSGVQLPLGRRPAHF